MMMTMTAKIHTVYLMNVELCQVVTNTIQLTCACRLLSTTPTISIDYLIHSPKADSEMGSVPLLMCEYDESHKGAVIRRVYNTCRRVMLVCIVIFIGGLYCDIHWWSVL